MSARMRALARRKRVERDREGGAAALEYLSMVTLFLVVLIVCFQVYATYSTLEKVDDAARTGAREGSKVNTLHGQMKANQQMPDWLNGHTTRVYRVDDAVRCDIRAKVPVLFRSVPWDVTVVRHAEIPVGG